MSHVAEVKRKKISTQTFLQMKKNGQRISMLTAYDAQTAEIMDESGVHSILVGDSLGMVVLGYETTLQVTMEDMLHHCKAVARGAKTRMRCEIPDGSSRKAVCRLSNWKAAVKERKPFGRSLRRGFP
jgi:ketopantoate hydroxymethyltransferase